jgi:hypothetical protein
MLHGVLNMPLPDDPKDLGQVEWMQFRDRARQASKHIRDLEAQLAQRDAALKAADELVRECVLVDEYLTNLQTPGSEPLNSVNASSRAQDRRVYTAAVRNRAREAWAKLGNAMLAYRKARGQDA